MSIASRMVALVSDIEQKAKQPNGLEVVDTDLLTMLLSLCPHDGISGFVLKGKDPNSVGLSAKLTEQTGQAIRDELKRRRRSKKGGG